MKRTIFFVAIFSFIFSSCTKDVIDYTNTVSDPKPASNTISFTYKGSLYSTTYSITKDSTIIWDSKEVENLCRKLYALPELATLVKADGSIEYYDSFNEVPVKHTNTFELRSAGVPVSIHLYVDVNYIKEGYSNEYNIPNPAIPNFINIPDKNGGNMNDKLSSFTVLTSGNNTGFSVTLFQDTNYGGKSVTIPMSDLSGLWVPSLMYPNYTMTGGLFGASWNDQVSSMKVN